ncbi:uncharacterized protein N7498_002717 [Penicillium cinerascens]|uniref:Nephrocystin 3-like N-terminal domain-containing protein n=1 Tax=Penicillium cinerascens TaxID=70096 RepID=A0A9W9NAI5_9EURO|nr:uncharacterized protein N7498_002717 [Penicillium cinerascens]KAJ5216310.1 hypothetical protein N7498_002717 [Penicillium cinerascens]
MDGVSNAASIIAVIQLAGTVLTTCVTYFNEVKDAKNDIHRLHLEVASLTGLLNKVSELLHSPDGTDLSASKMMVDSMNECFSTLTALDKRIDPGNRHKIMTKWGIRALKWPLKKDELRKTVEDIERCKTALNLALQVDQTTLINALSQTIDLAKLPTALGAEFDSYSDQHEDQCLPGTRSEILGEINDWVELSQGRCIFWLNGMAGTGKSTISRTVARTFQGRRLLGASFLFKRGEGDRGNATRFFSTLVTQLMHHMPQLIPAVRRSLEADPGIVGKSLRDQFQNLIYQPLRELRPVQNSSKIVIVIDALDECDREEDVRVLLQLLPRMRDSGVPIRIFLTSRPELPIRLGFKQIANEHQDLILHEIPELVIKRDLSLFLNNKLAKIRCERALAPDWPGGENIEALAALSAPLFIFAATVCLFVGDRNWSPEKRLAAILQDQALNRTSRLDRTYLPILNQLLTGQDEEDSKQLLREFQDIIGIIVLLASPLSVNALSRFLDIPKDDICNRLDSFHSVLSVPKDPDTPLRILHLSFRDFLVNPDRKGKSPFWIDEKEMHRKIANQCLTIMQRGLKENICDLPSHGTSRADLDSQAINCYLSTDLQYSCRYWVYHLDQGGFCVPNRLNMFLQQHFLHWLEAMSLLELIFECVDMIHTLQSLTQDQTEPKISGFLQDAKRFILKNIQIADTAPLQLYCSCLVYAPWKCCIRKAFEKKIPGWITRLPWVDDEWDTQMQTLEGHSQAVTSVTFSPDGRLLASGSLLGTIQLWEPASGALKQTLETHLGAVTSVKFSPDSKLVVAGNGRMVQFWDTATGSLQRILEGHPDIVKTDEYGRGRFNTVAYSSDDQIIATGHMDGTIKIWDSARGLQHTLKGHLSHMRSVKFSPDNKLVASGSADRTVKLWDAASGTLQQTLECESPVLGFSFSPNGKQLAVCVYKTFQIWDIATGTLQHTIHEDLSYVDCVAFSPDWKRLASAFRGIAKVRDITTGTELQALTGHGNYLYSLAFSPDGKLLESGSWSGLIHLWEITTRNFPPAAEIERHLEPVVCVTVSPNGKLVASYSSDDETTKLWDAVSGTIQHSLEGHSNRVRAVAFSPDGKMVATGSADHKVKFWDTTTGILQHTLEVNIGPIESVAFSSDSRLLAAGTIDGTISTWATFDGTIRQKLKGLKGHRGGLGCVAFSPDGELLAAGFDYEQIELWDITTGILKQSIEFTPRGNLSESGFDDVTKDFLDNWLAQGRPHLVQSVAFSPDGNFLASSSGSLTIKIWEIATGILKDTVERHPGHIKSMVWSDNGQCLETSIGSFDIQSQHENSVRSSKQPTVKVSLHDQWIALQGDRALWMPPEYRPTCSFIRGGTVVLGHYSGRVSTMEFST